MTIFLFLSGYGNQTPTTIGGKACVVLFALFGIPLVAVILGEIGSIINLLNNKFLSKQFSTNHINIERKLKKCFIPLVGVVIFVILPALVISTLEDWTYGESIYFCFVTLTTIGFGDYVAGK